MTIKNEKLISCHELRQMIRPLKSTCAPRLIAHWLLDIAGSYNRWLDQLRQTTEEGRYTLRMIANLLAKQADEAELRRCVGKLRDASLTALWTTIVRTGLARDPADAQRYLDSATIDWGGLGKAASEAEEMLPKGGDYSNDNLWAALELLVLVYERATGKKATWSSTLQADPGHNGGGTSLVTSPCGLFIRQFFKAEWIVKRQPVAETEITNLLKAYLAERRKTRRPPP